MADAVPLTLLKRLLETAGYRVDARPEALVGVRGEDHRAVVLDRARRTPVEHAGLFPGDAVHRTLVYDRDPGPLAREEAAERGIEVLDAGTLGPALGELLLPVPGPVPAPGDDPLDAPFPVPPPDGRTVRPRIDRTEAAARIGLRDARYALRLVPFWVAAYRVRTVGPSGGPGPVAQQVVAVHGLTRLAEFWDDGERDLGDPSEVDAVELPGQVGAPLAARLALEAVRRRHAGRVDHTEQHAGALVIESRRVLPAVEDVRLGPLTLVWVPYWYAEGTGGRVVLDAVTGRAAELPEPGGERGVPE